ncbi:MAG TPA: glycosyltransferase [Elusimicrobiales bacterium]|nr:glycosyltransferase [Elusimicrobiales bacterium]
MSVSELLWNRSRSLYRAYAAWRALRTGSLIERELAYYRRLRDKLGELPSLEDRLRKRLEARGIRPAPKPVSGIHVLYASRPSSWERHNIQEEISGFCRLTPYYYGERGFDDNRPDWISGRHKLDEDLFGFVKNVHKKRPVDIFLGYLSGWQVSPETIKRIGALGIATCGFHLDDKVSFRGRLAGGRWSGPAALAAGYDLNLTSTPSSVMKYEAEGGCAMFWPEGANPAHFKPLGLPYVYDVSFVGARYGYRPILIDFLERSGVKVAAFGPGWPGGAVTEDKMVEIYSRSRVNLGFGGIGYSWTSHLKGRDFEVPMCGAVYLTSANPELGSVYEVGRDIFDYRDRGECLSRINEILADYGRYESLKAGIRKKCLAAHTWSSRFAGLFKILGFN